MPQTSTENEKKTPLILWNKAPYCKELEKIFGTDSVATSNAELEGLLKEDSDSDCLIILAELSWGGKNLSLFQGFELAEKLLLDGFTKPLVFCSFQRREFFYNSKSAARFLSPMPFTFLQLPLSRQQWEEKVSKIRAFSPMLQAYIRENCLVKGGRLKAIVHRLRNGVSQQEQFNQICKRSFDDLDVLHVSLPLELIQQRKTIEHCLSQGNIAAAAEETKSLVEKLDKFASTTSSTASIAAPEKASYGIVIVEDNEQQLKRLQQEMEKYFDVFATRSSTEALKELQNDLSHEKYFAIVADWELLEEDGFTWQEMQGFDLLAEAGRTRPLCLIALTSLSKDAVSSILRPSPVKIHWFSKEEVGNNARWSYYAFAQYMIEQITNILLEQLHEPSGDLWQRRGLKELFIDLRYHSGKWPAVELDIKEKANQIIKAYYSVYCQGGTIHAINKNPHKLILPGDDTVPNNNHLLCNLILRLVSLGLHFGHKIQLENIYRLLYCRDDKEDVTASLKRFCSNIGFSTNRKETAKFEIDTSTVMKYEREWLTKQYRVEIDVITETEILEDITDLRDGLKEQVERLCGKIAAKLGSEKEALTNLYWGSYWPEKRDTMEIASTDSVLHTLKTLSLIVTLKNVKTTRGDVLDDFGRLAKWLSKKLDGLRQEYSWFWEMRGLLNQLELTIQECDKFANPRGSHQPT